MEQLDTLEKRINLAIEVIEKLQVENRDLQKELTLLRSETELKDERILQLKKENQDLKLLQSETSLGKEKEEKIRSKVEQMLAKLDELQSL